MEIQDVHHPSKRFRTHSPGGGGITGAAAAKLRHKEPQQEENGEVKARASKGAAPPGAIRPQWHPHSPAASRICRVSRASGGKDRHSKVLTAKGLRDRRVRLSVPTAIQFYDLQDRLGYDQPSKAVEWLIKAAAAAIADLPSLDGAFPAEGDTPPVVEEQEDAEVAELELADQHRLQEQQQPKSACSSTSETSKGSVLSLSRSEIRIKARVRARERTATAKEKENDKDNGGDHEGATQFTSVQGHHLHSLNLQPSSQSSSFIELLTCGGGQQNQSHTHGPVPNHIPKQLRHSPSSPATVKADLFGQVGLFGEEGDKPQHPPGFPSQAHFNIAATRDHQELHQQQQQQFSFMPEHLIPMAVTAAGGGDYINFSISSGIAGFNRGTLQSNFAPAQPNHHLQRLSSPVDGPNLPFFLSAPAQAASASWEGPFPAGFDSRLQLCYDGYRHSDLKGKGKN